MILFLTSLFQIKKMSMANMVYSFLSKFMLSCRSDAVTLPDPLRSVSPNSSFSFSGSLLDLSLSDVPLGSVSVNPLVPEIKEAGGLASLIQHQSCLCSTDKHNV